MNENDKIYKYVSKLTYKKVEILIIGKEYTFLNPTIIIAAKIKEINEKKKEVLLPVNIKLNLEKYNILLINNKKSIINRMMELKSFYSPKILNKSIALDINNLNMYNIEEIGNIIKIEDGFQNPIVQK